MVQHKRDALLTTVFVGSAVFALLLQGAPARPASGGAGGRPAGDTLNGRPGADAPAGSADPNGFLENSGAGGGGNGGGPSGAGGAGGRGYTYPTGDGPLVESPGGAGGVAGTNASRNGGDGGDAPASSTSGAGGGGGGASGNDLSAPLRIDNAGVLTGGDGGRGGRAINYDTARPGSVQGGGGGGAGGWGAVVTLPSLNRSGGLIQGGAGGAGGDGQAAGGGGVGGIGLLNPGLGTFTNAGAILGGSGGDGGGTARADGGSGGAAGAGGAGVVLSNSNSFTNAASGTVTGGAGGIGGTLSFFRQAPRTTPGASGDGGAGLSGATGASVANAGTIRGGTGGAGAVGVPGFVEASGSSGATATTGGTGGTGGAGGRGGAGVDIAGVGSFSHTGTLSGGAGGTGGTGGAANGGGEGRVDGPPEASGGAGGTGGTGGTGLRIGGGTGLSNSGTVQGGDGGQGGAGGLSGFSTLSRSGNGGQGGAGGIGAQVAAPDFTNSGTISGGQGGAGGAFGAAGASGASGPSGVAGRSGTGGTGLVLDGATRLTNTRGGLISGGYGRDSTTAGGIGVLASGGGTLFNAGRIEGGGATGSGPGGTAIVGADLAIVNSGRIVVGSGATGPGGPETGRAISFTGGVNSLTLISNSQITGSQITGTVAAFSAADRLILGGTTTGTFSTAAIGPQYQNFGVFQKVDAGVWTLTGTTAAATPWQVLGGTLAIGADGSLGASSGGILLDGGTLRITASLSTNRTVTLGAAGGTIETRSRSAMSAGGPFVGAGGLTVTGGGLLTLSGANTYTGETTVDFGTLALAAGGSLASSVTTLVDGRFSNTGTVAGGLTNDGTATNDGTIAGPVVNSGTFVNRGTASALTSTAGTVTNTGTFTGAATITGGSLALGPGSLLDGALTNGATVTAQGRIAGQVTNLAGASFTLSGPLADLTALSNAGTVSLAGNGLGIGTLTGEGGVIQNASGTAATLTLGSGSNGGSVLQDGAGGGALSVAKVGDGTLTLSGISTYTGATTVAAGTLALAAGGSLASSVTTEAIGIFSNAGTVGGGLTNAGATTNDGTIAGAVANSGSFVNRGTAGALTSTAGTVTNTGTLAGAATITGGSLALGPGSLVDGALTNGATVTAQGRIAGPVTNLTGASFTLSGPLADLTALTNAGTVSLAGNGLGVSTLTGEGGVIQNASGTAATLALGSGSNGGSLLQDGAGGGALSVAKVGAGTLTLTGANTYSGGTAFNGGTLLAASDASLGAATGALSFGGGTLATGATFTTGRTLTLGTAGGTLAPDAGGSLTLTGIVGGPGGLTVGGTGRVVLTGTGSYGGGTTVNAGATLQVGDGGTAGAIAGNILTNGTLTLARSDRLDLAGIISGSGTLNQSGPGLTALTGSNGPGAQFTGTATATGGALAINGTFGDTAGNRAIVTVEAGGTLLGSGTIAGSVAVNGGTVSAGNSPGTLTVAGNYALAPGSTSLFEFGSPGIVGGASNDLVVVGGDLRLGGTLGLVSASAATIPPVSGAYRLFNYGGTVSGAFDGITTPGPGTAALVYTDIPNQVNALLTNGNQSVQFWDGTDTTGAAAGGQGGTGTWSAGSTNWTLLPGGQINDVWRSGVGLFGGSAGTVTVAGAQAVQGLQFTVDGYRIGGSGTLTLTGDPFTTPGQSFVTVDTGVSATIATALTGQNAGIGLRKLGDGTLTLSGISTYTGATTVAAGTLVLAAGGSLASSVATLAGGRFSNAGTVGGGLTNAGATTNDGTIAGPVANSGTFVNRGTAGALTSTAGTVTSTGTFTGAATITGGSLALGPGSLVDGALTNGAVVTAQGRIAGPVTNLTGASFTLSGPLADLTALSNAGTVSLAGNGLGIGTLTGEGGVIQNASGTAATLTLGAGSSGSVLQDGAGGGALALAKVGAGTLTLSGISTYTGATTVAAGTLALAGSGTLAASSGLILAGGATFDIAGLTNGGLAVRSLGDGAAGGTGTVALGANRLTLTDASGTFSGGIIGTGGLTLAGGSQTLTGASTYTGATTVAAGTLALAAGGSLASPVATLAGGRFSNAGTVGGGLTNDGTTINDGTIAGAVANSGSFVNRGTAGALTSTAGTVTNTGTFAGAATITGGSLALGSSSLLDGALTNGATVTAQGRIAGPVTNLAGASFTLSGPVADLTALTNAGTVSLAGNGLGIGTLTGQGGVIQNGAATAATLTLGSGSSGGSVLQDGAGGGALSVAKVGAGTLTLTGDNTYGGGTRVAGGVLALGSPGAAGTGAIALDAGTRLAFLGSGYTVANALRLTGPAAATIDSGPGTVALSGPISGAGALEKAGLGTLVVTGTGTYTGATAVAAGILQVDGAFTGSSILTVGPGAGLTGTGRVGAVAVQSGGFVAPGNAANPTGTLTAEGPVVLQGGATLATTLSLTAASRLVTASTATIASGGILQITPSALAYATPVRLPILVAGAGLTGQFSTVTFTAPVRGLQPTVGYDATNAYIQFGESAPDGPTPPGPDLTSAIAAAQGLARDRIGAFVTQRVLGSVLTGFNQQISCGDCFSGFGMAGSYSVGAQGRKALTEELIAIGGFAYTGYDSGRVRVSGAPIFAGLLRYDPAGFGSARPFVDVGGLFAPSQKSTYSRTYSFGTMTGQGTAQIASTGASVFARVGAVARLSPQDEIAAAVEYSRGWQYAGAYNEGLLAPNPYALASDGGTDVINIAKVGGQYTHLFGSAIETQVNLGVAHGFDLRSGLRGTVAGVPFSTPIKDLTWAEYGARISYRLQRNLALDAFILGTLGPQPVGDTIHGGASVRYAF
jgi:fibronectin-binding autotransporter adhesin